MARPRIYLNDKQEKKAKTLFLRMMQRHGSQRVGNISMLNAFLNEAKEKLGEPLGDQVYWNIRNSLIDEGRLERGKGKGGTIRLLDFHPKKEGKKKAPRTRESALYEPFHETIQKSWVQEYAISEFASEVTANKGRTDTGGKWTRPDVTLIAIGNHEFLPGKTLEVITFEIKPEDSYGIQSVYEAASHSAYANKSYLAIHLTVNAIEEELLERLEKEAIRFGIGLITFEDPGDWNTFEVMVEAQHKTPSPSDINFHLNRLLAPEIKQKVLRLVK